MKTNSSIRNKAERKTALLCLAFTVLGYLHFAGFGSKWITLLAGFTIIFLLAFSKKEKLVNLPTLFLLGYVAFSWLTVFWAMSGKFHLRDFSKIFTALALFLFITLRGKNDKTFVRRVMGIVAGVSAIYAFMSVEAAATGICRTLVQKLPGVSGLTIAFAGSRLFGVFGNSNVEASIFAIGVLFSLALVCTADTKGKRILSAVVLSFNAFAFLLVFSMGAIACFVAAVIIYLIAAGEQRGALLSRMLLASLSTAPFAVLSTRFFDRGGLAFVSVALLFAGAAVTALLEVKLGEKFSALLQSRQKLTVLLLAAGVGLAVLFIVAGTLFTGAYTFGGELRRTISLDAGEHTILLDADAPVSLNINSQSRIEIMSMQETSLFSGECGDKATFTMPEDAIVCSISFTAPMGTTLRTAAVDGETQIALDYKLLPDFIGNRVQNLSNNTSVVQRGIFREDGMKLFRLSPIVGNGVGAYETGLSSVQDFHYETKFVHNHYIQVLLEDGVIGFALYLAALLTLAAALWKKRGQVDRFIYAALCAELVMSCAQMLWDLSMSFVVFICMAYVNYALIVLTCAEPCGKVMETTADPPAKKKKTVGRKKEIPLPQIIGAAVAGIIVLTLCGNMYAGGLSSKPVSSMDGFFRNQDRAVNLDLYEHNDAKLSYVMYALEDESGTHIPQANAYAEELAQVHSNSIPRYLVAYYLQTGQLEAAIDEAMLGATYSATDDDTWNECASLLKQVFFDSGSASPLLTEREALMPHLTAYYDMLQEHNAAAVLPVVPNESAQTFFDKVAALRECGDDENAFAAVLMAQ